MGSIRLIAIDMDGTLLKSDHWTVSERNAEALRKANDAGIQVWISTGRLPEDASDFAHRYNLSCGILCCNGAVAYNGPLPDGQEICRTTFEPDDAHAIVDLLAQQGIMINAFEAGRVTTIAQSPEHHYHLLARGLIEESRGEDAMHAAADRGILKFYTMQEPKQANVSSEKMEHVRVLLEERFPYLQVTRSGPGIVELMPANVGKGKTLGRIADLYSIAPEQVMAIGDEENDLDMLHFAGFNVAMGNASDKVMKVCRYITADNDRDGVAEAVAFALGKKNSLCRKR